MSRTLQWQMLLAICALGLWWLAQRLEREDRPLRTVAKENRVDYIAHGVLLTLTDETGQPVYQLSADESVHYLPEQTTEMRNPRLVLYRANRTVGWIITAERSHLSADGELLQLFGAVHLERGESIGRPLNIHTREVTVHPKLRTATSAEEVEIVSPTDRVVGVGMEAELTPQLHMKLLSRVRGTHEAR